MSAGRDQALHKLEKENQALRKLLAELRPVLVTNKHKQMVDTVLKTRPPV